MLTLVIIVIVLCLLIFGMVKVIDKYVNPKFRPVISIVLWAITILFGYLIYQSIQAPIRFDKIKEGRYRVAVAKMQEIKKVQLAYKAVKGVYSDNMDSIINFIENDYFVITDRKDTAVIDVERNKAFGIKVDETGKGGYFKDEVIIREIGRVKVKDSLYKDSERYKRLNRVRVDGITADIRMRADYVIRNNSKVPVFEARLNKADLLTDQDPDLVSKEKRVESVEGINGEHIILGSIEEVNMTGNWPKKYGNNE